MSKYVKMKEYPRISSRRLVNITNFPGLTTSFTCIFTCIWMQLTTYYKFDTYCIWIHLGHHYSRFVHYIFYVEVYIYYRRIWTDQWDMRRMNTPARPTYLRNHRRHHISIETTHIYHWCIWTHSSYSLNHNYSRQNHLGNHLLRRISTSPEYKMSQPYIGILLLNIWQL